MLVKQLQQSNRFIPYFKNFLGDYDENRVKFMVTQDFEDEIEEGKRLLTELAGYVSAFRRESAPLTEIVLGMKCGGSDGMSGITANALIGRICDAMTGMGGRVMLTEVPEMFGAEQMLMILPTFSRSSLCLFMHFFLFSALPVNVESQSQLFL